MTANEELEDHLAALYKLGLSQAYLERTLDLPMGEIEHWRGARVPFEGLALMRVLRAFPWIVTVAEAHYEPNTAKRTLLFIAAEMAFPEQKP
jgi:hypothetical protein